MDDYLWFNRTYSKSIRKINENFGEEVIFLSKPKSFFNFRNIESDGFVRLIIVITLLLILVFTYYHNSTNGIEQDIPTDLIAGLIGAVIEIGRAHV